MTLLTRLCRATMLVLLTTLVASMPRALAQGAGSTGARTISNVATIEWDRGTQRLTLASNRIDLAVEPVPLPLSLTAFRFADNSASQHFPVAAPVCATPTGAQAA